MLFDWEAISRMTPEWSLLPTLHYVCLRVCLLPCYSSPFSTLTLSNAGLISCCHDAFQSLSCQSRAVWKGKLFFFFYLLSTCKRQLNDIIVTNSYRCCQDTSERVRLVLLQFFSSSTKHTLNPVDGNWKSTWLKIRPTQPSNSCL